MNHTLVECPLVCSHVHRTLTKHIFSYIKSGKMLPTLDDDVVMCGYYEIERMGVKYPASVHLNSPFDPTFRRMMGKYKEKDQKKLRLKLDEL